MKQREPRRSVFVHARMRCGTDWVDVCIHNMSSRGMLVHADQTPAAGAYVEIRKARHVVIGRAVWKSGRRFGVRTQDRIDIDAILHDAARADGDRGDAAPPERRIAADRDAPDPLRRLERSRRIAALAQFAIVAAGGAAAAAFAAGQVQTLLSQPIAAVESALTGRR